MRKLITCTLPNDVIDIIDELHITTSLPKSKVVEALVNITRTYFTDEQIIAEIEMMSFEDGRRGRRGRINTPAEEVGID